MGHYDEFYEGAAIAARGEGVEPENAAKIREMFGRAQASPPDLCICGTMTRAEHGCLCAPEIELPGLDEETVLQEADRLTQYPRGKTYGHPYDDFTKVTNMALALWGRGPESPEEHALYQILVKLARLEATPGHHDSIVDIAGYAKAYDMVIQEKVARLTNPA